MADYSARFADTLSYHLRLAHERVQQGFSAALAQGNLAPIQAELLRLIGSHPGIKPSDVADALARDRSSITAALHTLTQHALIRREASRRDRRIVQLHLTEVGQQVLGVVTQAMDAQEQLLDRIVGPDDKPRLIELLRQHRGSARTGRLAAMTDAATYEQAYGAWQRDPQAWWAERAEGHHLGPALGRGVRPRRRSVRTLVPRRAG